MENLLKFGRSLYGMGISCLGIQQFIYSDFRPVFLQEWPAWVHVNSFWPYLSGTALILAGIFIVLGKKVRIVSFFLGGMLFVQFLAFQVPFLLFMGPNSPLHLGLWTNPLKELALSGGAFVIAGSDLDQRNITQKKTYSKWVLVKFILLGRIFFSITMIAFGIDHFLYTKFVSTLVPSWIPGPIFWTYFAGIALIGSGLVIIFKIRLKLVGLLLAIMLFIWLIILHIPRAVDDPYIEKGNEVTSVFEALAFCGIALVIANTQKNKDNLVNLKE